MLRAGGAPPSGNISNFTVPDFTRIWPDYVMVIPSENVVSGFNNNNGNHNMSVNTWAGTPKVPANAKGLILNVSCIIQAVGVLGTYNFSEFTVYNDTGFLQPVDKVRFSVYEWAAVAANTTIGETYQKILVPIVGGKIYYSVNGTKANQNFDQFLVGYWDS